MTHYNIWMVEKENIPCENTKTNEFVPSADTAGLIYGYANLHFPQSLTGQSAFIASICAENTWDPLELRKQLLRRQDLLRQLQRSYDPESENSPFYNPVKLENLRLSIKKVFHNASLWKNLPPSTLENICDGYQNFIKPQFDPPTGLLQNTLREADYATFAQEVIANYLSTQS